MHGTTPALIIGSGELQAHSTVFSHSKLQLGIGGVAHNLRRVWKKVWILTWLRWRPPSNLQLLPDTCPHYHIIPPSTSSSLNSSSSSKSADIILLEDSSGLSLDKQAKNDQLPSQSLYHLSSEITVRGDRISSFFLGQGSHSCVSGISILQEVGRWS